jgi:hypothetical protein
MSIEKGVSYKTYEIDHKWPTRKQLTIDDYNNTSVVKQKKTSAIVSIYIFVGIKF